MTDEQRRRIHEILYSTQSREELAKRIVALEDENANLREQVTQLQDDWESERDYAYQMEAKEKKAVGENAKLRELLSMYMTFARTVARGLSIQSAYADGMGMKLDEAEMRGRAMEFGIEWCR